jgi:hypothetical protein
MRVAAAIFLHLALYILPRLGYTISNASGKSIAQSQMQRALVDFKARQTWAVVNRLKYMKLLAPPSYETPEGSFLGTIHNVVSITDTKRGEPREHVRLTMKVDPLPEYPHHDFRVRADFWSSQGDELFQFLFRLMGPDIVNLTDEHGNLLPERLHLLHGRRVAFDVRFDTKPGYTTAFRKVTNLRPLDLRMCLAA